MRLYKRAAVLLMLLMFIGLAPAQAQGTTTIRLWIMPTGIDLTRRIGIEVRLFEEANPDVRVEVELIEWSDALTFFREANANLRNAPDVLQVGSTWMSTLASESLLLPLDAEQQAAVGGATTFSPILWEASFYEDQFYSVPWTLDTRAIIYRRDILEQVGIDPATAFDSWESLDTTLQTLRDANLFVYASDETPLQVYPIAIPGRPETNAVHDLAPWIWGAGGTLLTEDATTAAFNQPAALQGIRYYTNFHLNGYTPPNMQGFTLRDSDSWFINRRAVMTISGAWIIQRLRTTGLADDIGVQLLPAGEAGRYSFAGGSGLAVWQGTQQPEAALRLIRFLTAAESQTRFTQNAGLLPARADILASDFFTQDPDYRVFADAIQYGRTYPRINNWAEVEVTLSNEIERMWEEVVVFPTDFEDPARLEQIVASQAQAVNQVLSN